MNDWYKFYVDKKVHCFISNKLNTKTKKEVSFFLQCRFHNTTKEPLSTKSNTKGSVFDPDGITKRFSIG